MAARTQAVNPEQRGGVMTISPGRLLVTIQDSCSELGGISRTTLYSLVNQGELVKVSIGRRSFVTAESLAAYVDRLAEAASA
jgi:predicted DNA-binding transcriptional regulator AlpA